MRLLEWLPHKDSNLNKQIQNLRCYHYTMRQWVKTARIIPYTEFRRKGQNSKTQKTGNCGIIATLR